MLAGVSAIGYPTTQDGYWIQKDTDVLKGFA
jgi:hypothetical protein